MAAKLRLVNMKNDMIASTKIVLIPMTTSISLRTNPEGLAVPCLVDVILETIACDKGCVGACAVQVARLPIYGHDYLPHVRAVVGCIRKIRNGHRPAVFQTQVVRRVRVVIIGETLRDELVG